MRVNALRVGWLWALLKEAAGEWSEDRAPRLGAALAYYTVFSIAPLLIVVIAITGLVFGEEGARSAILGQVGGIIGEKTAKALEDMLQHAQRPSAGILGTILGLGTLLLGASGLFGQLQDALNTVWEVKPKPGRGIMGFLKDRFLSFVALMGTAFLLLVSLVLDAGLSAMGEALSHWLPGPEAVLQVINFLLSFGVVTLLFAMIFKLLPDVKIQWGDVWIGAGVTALLFTVGKFLIGLYLGKSDIASAYGAAGSLVLLLIWVYYSAQILLFGAEFTKVYADRYGSRIEPAETAVPVSEATREKEGRPSKERATG